MLTRREINTQVDPQQSFSQVIMDNSIPPHYMILKITPFLGSGYPEAHLKAFFLAKC